MLWMRWGSKNMCSVRVRPMPSAPKFRATSASCGVSAFVRTFSVRYLSPLHDLRERAGEGRFLRRDLALVDLADAAIKAQPILRAIGLAVGGKLLRGRVDVQRAGAGDAWGAHAAGDDGR